MCVYMFVYLFVYLSIRTDVVYVYIYIYMRNHVYTYIHVHMQVSNIWSSRIGYDSIEGMRLGEGSGFGVKVEGLGFRPRILKIPNQTAGTVPWWLLCESQLNRL